MVGDAGARLVRRWRGYRGECGWLLLKELSLLFVWSKERRRAVTSMWCERQQLPTACTPPGLHHSRVPASFLHHPPFVPPCSTHPSNRQQGAIANEVAAAGKRMAAKWHALQHMITTEQEQLAEQAAEAAAEAAAGAGPPAAPAAAPGGGASSNGASSSNAPGSAAGSSNNIAAAAAAAAGPSTGEAAAGAGPGQQQQQQASCPICLDEYTSGSVTSCGHSFW